jgi:hypothetical protein
MDAPSLLLSLIAITDLTLHGALLPICPNDANGSHTHTCTYGITHLAQYPYRYGESVADLALLALARALALAIVHLVHARA